MVVDWYLNSNYHAGTIYCLFFLVALEFHIGTLMKWIVTGLMSADRKPWF